MNSKDLYFRLLGYVRPHLRIFILSIVATLITAATEPLLPALLKPLLDGSFVEKDPTAIALMPLLLVGVFVVRGVSGFAGAVAMRWVANQVVTDLRGQMFDKILHLPTRRFNDTPGGVLLSKLTYDVNQVMTACTQSLVVLVRDSVAVAGLLIWIFWLNWQLALASFLIAPLVAVAARIVGKRLRRLSRELQGTMGDLNHVVEEAIQGHKVIKIFGGQDYEAQRFHRVNNRVRRFNMKSTVAAEASVPIIQTLVAVAMAVVVYIASMQSLQGAITVGGFVSLFTAMSMLLAPIKRLTRLNEQLQRGLAAAESVFALIDEPPEPDQGGRQIGRARGQVTFEGVELRYGQSDNPPALKRIDLEVRPGETVALVGPSGSGKSSLMNLLPRFYERSGGRILLDGEDIADLKLAALRSNIAYVGQEIVLFNDTVAANIAYGLGDSVSRAAIEEAAEHANAMEFIRQLPQGLDTPIGEKGTRLSGGQRQRLAIARALLKDAPILILDEATSALDTHSERKVQQALETLRRGRTAFIIAHRLSTVESADRIVVLDQGEIVEVGSHAELLARQGLYASLYRMQIKESAQ